MRGLVRYREAFKLRFVEDVAGGAAFLQEGRERGGEPIFFGNRLVLLDKLPQGNNSSIG